MEESYPYLARFKDGSEQDRYVVWFLEKDYGVVVMSQHENVKFGTLGDFDESMFEILGEDQVIRLSNFPIGSSDKFEVKQVGR